jgi:hypothetical protein
MAPPAAMRFQGEGEAVAAKVQKAGKAARGRLVAAEVVAAQRPVEVTVMEPALLAMEAGTAQTGAALQALEAVVERDWVPPYSTTEGR